MSDITKQAKKLRRRATSAVTIVGAVVLAIWVIGHLGTVILGGVALVLVWILAQALRRRSK